MAIRDTIKTLLGSAWHVNSDAFINALFPASDGVNEAGKPVSTDSSGNATFPGAIKSSSPSGGVGYATGAGGAVTQATSKSTAVTLSKICGAITMNAASLAAGAEATFTVTNTAVAAGDVVVACHGSAGTSGGYNINVSNITAGTFDITVSNLSAGALAEAIVINFAIVKAVAA